jgi:hypothetical protein
MLRALAGAWYGRLAAGTLILSATGLLALFVELPARAAGYVASGQSSSVSAPSGATRGHRQSLLLGALGGAIATTTSLASFPNPSTFGSLVTAVATVNPASVSGSVTLYDGANGIASSPLVGGVATTTVSTLTAGMHQLIAVYDGDGNHKGSIADPVAHLVLRTSTNTGIVSSPNPSMFGQLITVVASVTPPVVTGSVTFYDGTASLGSLPLLGGMATTTVATLAAGPHLLTAVYNGDSNAIASTSAALTQTVNLPPTIISSDTATFGAGSAGTFTVRATGYPIPILLKSGALPSGIAFLDGGDGTATISGTATVGGSYQVVIAATNGVAPSAIQIFTLIIAAPPVQQNAVSRKVHDGAGTFDLPLFPGP